MFASIRSFLTPPSPPAFPLPTSASGTERLSLPELDMQNIISALQRAEERSHYEKQVQIYEEVHGMVKRVWPGSSCVTTTEDGVKRAQWWLERFDNEAERQAVIEAYRHELTEKLIALHNELYESSAEYRARHSFVLQPKQTAEEEPSPAAAASESTADECAPSNSTASLRHRRPVSTDSETA